MAAYNAPGFSSSVSDPSPALGQPFNVALSGATPGEAITLTVTTDPASISSASIEIAGTKAFTRVADANGAVAFAVTLTAGGTYTLTMTNPSGAVLSTQTVAAGLAPGANSPVVAGSSGSSGVLTDTGYGGTGLAIGGVLLVLAGAGATMFARRRKTAYQPS